MSLQASRYSAFVSYRRLPKDTYWAEWLVASLSDFETPKALKLRGTPEKVGPLFRDDNEIAASSDLSGELKAALWDSSYLIVVCSPETPKSNWVRAEIALFQHWGRADHVLALLIEGGPEDSYPELLRQYRMVGEGRETVMELIVPAGADVTPRQNKTEQELKELARNRILSTLLGCSFAQLRESLEEERRSETVIEYFHDVVRRRGIPEGLGELTAQQVSHREYSYQFEIRAGRVQRVRRVDSHGILREGGDEIAQWDVTYRSSGAVEAVDQRNRHGGVKVRESYSRDGRTVDFLREDDTAVAQAGFVGGMGFAQKLVADLQARRSGIVRHRLD